MSRFFVCVWYMFYVFLCSFFYMMVPPQNAHAALATSEARIISDSQELFNRRIYSYDMGIDSYGNIHIVYSKPYSDRKANIYYVRRVGGIWQSDILLTPDGFRPSGSTFLVIGSDNRIHICYIKDEGTSESLNYIVINENGVVVKPETFVDDGGWHSRMQLDSNGYPVFVRGGKKWPEPPSRLVLLTTLDGTTWDKSYLNVTPVEKFRLADFVYANGTYHITYGDSAYTKEVWDGKGMTARIDGTFHDFYYITSQDGTNWTEHVIDNSHTLYESEFWTALVLVDGRPLIAMYKYAEYGGIYNRGTSARLSEWTGSSWTNKIITNQTYPDTSEGMGVGLVVNASGDYFGAWDFSPDDTHDDDFRGPRGNIAMARSGPQNDWTPKVQVDPFSLEGRTRLRIHGGKLFFLALGDFVDSKLYFREYNISDLNAVLPPTGGGVTPSTNSGEGTYLPAVYHMLLHPVIITPPSGLVIP
ncbi:MAG: hypothetical protein OEM01_09555 [Desulfobulbaceae bacterium]|nr:hypothetical protein [Desulfobulbaceae bacterium]